MPATIQRLLVRIGRWPRRIAAVGCLVLAAATALPPPAPATPAATLHHIGLRAGEVAVPVPIASGVSSVRPNDQVGVLAPPADDATGDAVLVADHLRVLSISRGSALTGDAATVVVVATDRAKALQVARYAARPLVMIMDDLP